MTDEMKEELKNLCGHLFFDEPMSRYTSIRIGGKADALLYPRSIDEVSHLMRWAGERGMPFTVLGSGSNLLVRDKGIRGIVVCLSQGFNTIRQEDPERIYVEAGVGIPRLVDFVAELGLSGLEPLAGIPGNLGGALIMNAGTSEGDISQRVETVTLLARTSRQATPSLTTWGREKLRFGYRESHFPRDGVLLSARFKLNPSTAAQVRAKVQVNQEKRKSTQPLNVPNLGSVFKNPKKGFAGAFIEEAGLKDVRVGGARISSKHANFIVNEGAATAREVLALIGLVRDKVKEKFGVVLEPEVKVVGEE